MVSRQEAMEVILDRIKKECDSGNQLSTVFGLAQAYVSLDGAGDPH